MLLQNVLSVRIPTRELPPCLFETEAGISTPDFRRVDIGEGAAGSPARDEQGLAFKNHCAGESAGFVSKDRAIETDLSVVAEPLMEPSEDDSARVVTNDQRSTGRQELPGTGRLARVVAVSERDQLGVELRRHL